MKQLKFLILSTIIILSLAFPIHIFVGIPMFFAIQVSCLSALPGIKGQWYCQKADSCQDLGGIWVHKYSKCCFDPYSGTDRECLELVDQDPAAFPDNIEIQIEEERARFNMPRKSADLETPPP
uniref:Uncharacterized protein n=1 Tax=Magnetococcus massalia (strain MO-1) TaxID=451514 RepID=A0A1S7LD40_MAGMO|nr:exported protein of unknown function [Candidatus Magnetococcus massalia]